MSFPTAGSYPNYSSDHASKYTPVIYAKKLLLKFYDKTVFGEIAQRDYEGEIKNQGDTVIIRTRPAVTISDYTRNMDLRTARQFHEPTAVELQIDKAKFYSVGLDTLDEKQFDINALDEWASDASEAMGITIDTDVLGNIASEANSSNYGLTAGAKSGAYNMGTTAAPLVATKANVLDIVADAASVLTEQAVPEDAERWMVMPTVITNRIQKSDLRTALFTGDSSNQTLRNGRIGMIDNFKIYASNNLTALSGTGATAIWPVIFGHKGALTFASQLVKQRTLELQDTFGSAMEGLQVYGYKVVNPKYMGYAAVQAG
ncbi:MAG: hypothetical protein P1P84_02695 [Deferrisomatales bacterium]|nr:hypothetical protein [Deferrisomatales bacterium]